MAPIFPRIQAATIDGRYHNIYHRQVELERLCKALTDNVNEIKQAISADYQYSESEIAVEYHLTLSAVKQYYASLSPKKAHDEEYLVASGKDAANHRCPAGIVYIEPIQHTLFYSTIVPLSAALAAGNCVIVLLENNLRAVSSLLRRLLPASLDADVLAIASSPVKDSEILSKALCVLQNGVRRAPSINELSSTTKAPVVAVVDRTADVSLAAKELVAARFSFSGHSPYAPDVVLVNEFRKADFLHAVVTECARVGSSVEMNGSVKGKTTLSGRITEQVELLKASDKGLRIVVQESKYAVVDISSRSAVLQTPIEEAVLAIHSIRSLDDAIDLINSATEAPCLAAYHFCNHATGKYLSQFVAAEATFINHIPRELLVGPPAPVGKPLDTSKRYPIELFTVPRPAFVKLSAQAATLATALSSSNNTTAQGLLKEAASPLKEVKRNPGGGVGFFEQGFLINAGLILTSIVLISVSGSFYLYRRSRPL
ncbi:Aldehyde dehydrogenase, dimeric NADP-preferring [Pseudocercospora fuligena]|uniref:Aldehyde dehydrogenase, dimeric NADP-preferring n=1 Tax=Pseudocercospora fuligena TaxID=685502 RepID=A0A8H6RMA9_9PEZI|nr:Aldehyde dehydrogenase, dimeric NADP-preferring [Pseudocercospora fuligena]